jgi:hypothetical protein
MGVRNTQTICAAKTGTALLFCKKEAKNSYFVRFKLPQLLTLVAKVFWFFFSKKNAFLFGARFLLTCFPDGHLAMGAKRWTTL